MNDLEKRAGGGLIGAAMMNGTVGRVPRAPAISDLKRRDASSGNETKAHRSREVPSGLEIHQVTPPHALEGL